MKTEDLIALLASEARQVAPGSTQRCMFAALAMSLPVSAVLMALSLRQRPRPQ